MPVSLDYQVTDQDYRAYFFFRAFEGYLESSKKFVPLIKDSFISAFADFGALYNPYATHVNLDAHKENNGTQQTSTGGEGFAKVVGTLPAMIEAIIDFLTRKLKSHSTIETSILRLNAAKSESYEVKHALIDSIISNYANKTLSTSKSTAQLLDALAVEKPINEHIDDLIKFLEYKTPTNTKLYYNNGKNMFNRIIENVNKMDLGTLNPLFDQNSVVFDEDEFDHNNVVINEDENATCSFNTKGVASTKQNFFTLDINSDPEWNDDDLSSLFTRAM